MSLSLSYQMHARNVVTVMASGLVFSIAPAFIAPATIKRSDVVMVLLAQSLSILTAGFFW